MAINGKKVFGMIPARGGSKRVFQKNITLYKGKPLIAWAMEHAAGCKYIDRFVVSTDDDAVAIHAKGHLLRRPDYLATDNATVEGVLAHALYASLPDEFDYAVVLQPTSPNRTVEDIERCLEALCSPFNKLHSCVSYNEFGKRNGAVYAIEVPHFLAMLSFDAANHYIMPNDRSLDINNLWDFLQ